MDCWKCELFCVPGAGGGVCIVEMTTWFTGSVKCSVPQEWERGGGVGGPWGGDDNLVYWKCELFCAT